MGQRPDDEVRGDPLGESRRETDPLADPAAVPEGVSTPVGPDPALGGGVGGGAVIDEEEANRVEIERTRTEIERTRADMSETVDAIQERLSPENLKEQAIRQGQGSHGGESPGGRFRYRGDHKGEPLARCPDRHRPRLASGERQKEWLLGSAKLQG